tara:strand:+ start:9939 stop:10208 length:270 start_codon:yes stop_codon:yes gene_type:complete
MIGKIFELINSVQSDHRSATDNKEYYDKYQRFFKSPPYEKTSVDDFMQQSIFKGRLSGCLRNLQVTVDKGFAQAISIITKLRNKKRNGN